MLCNYKFVVTVVPCRNALTPPELPAYAPVAHILHPVPVDIPELVREEPDRIIHHRVEGGFGGILHLHEPLQRELRLNDGMCAL